MSTARRVPVRFQIDAALHRKMKRAAERTGRSESDLANELLKQAWAAEEKHMRMLEERRKEPSLPYEEVAAELKRHGLL
jgi:hypothetical protein